jgi:MFS family permease
MDRNLKLLTLGVGVRTFGAALFYPFLALFLYSILHLGYFEIGVLIVAVGLVQMPFGLLGGLLADRVGRRRLILLGLAAESAASFGLAYGFSIRSLAVAVVAATLGGIITSAAGAAYSAYIADYAAGSDRTRAFTWYRIGFNAGFSAGVGLGGTLVALLGFPVAVAIAAVIIGVAAALLAALLRPSPYDTKLAAGLAARALTSAPQAARGRSLGQSLRIMARDRVAIEVAVAFLFASLVYGQWSVIFPLFVHNVMGISYGLLGAGLALNGLIVVVGQAPTTEAAIGWRHTSLGILAAVLIAASYLLLGVAGLFVLLPVAAFLAAVVVLTIGENVGAIPSSTLPSNIAPPEEIGAYNGAIGMFMGLGGLSATLVGGAVLSVTANPLLIWVLLASPSIPAVILFRLAARHIPGQADRA